MGQELTWVESAKRSGVRRVTGRECEGSPVGMRRVEEAKLDGDAKEAQATRDGSSSVERDRRHEASQATATATRGESATATRRELRRRRREIDRRRWNGIGDTR
ncbi:hypothetical protein SO802_023712 [Lithocarpus litseifolius]|uniref:Uncharacterized protein n=1 Tax=Lithocarpus litseifolius TaxID=425828 RepID=A0AAW2CAV2_9ROSI